MYYTSRILYSTVAGYQYGTVLYSTAYFVESAVAGVQLYLLRVLLLAGCSRTATSNPSSRCPGLPYLKAWQRLATALVRVWGVRHRKDRGCQLSAARSYIALGRALPSAPS